MTRTTYNVLFRKGNDLILFDFTADDDTTDLYDLICFHFTDRHDFDRMVKNVASSVFKNFYDDYYVHDVALIDWKEKRLRT